MVMWAQVALDLVAIRISRFFSPSRRLLKENIFMSLIFLAQIDIHSPGLKNCGKIEKHFNGIFGPFKGFCRMGSSMFTPLDVGEIFA